MLLYYRKVRGRIIVKAYEGPFAKDNYYCFCHTLYELYLLLASNPKQLALPRFHPCKQESSPSQGIFPRF